MTVHRAPFVGPRSAALHRAASGMLDRHDERQSCARHLETRVSPDRSAIRARWKRALAPLGEAEARERIGRRVGWRRLRAGRRFAVRGPLEPVRPLFEGLGGKAEYLEVSPAVRVWSRTRAKVVRMGKFDVDEVARLRAFYPDQGLSLRLQGADAGEAGVERELAARRLVADHAPDLAPRLAGHGRFGQTPTVDYLFEELLDAAPLSHPVQIGRHVGELTARLAELYRGVGISSTPLAQVVSEHLPARWTKACEEFDIDPAIDRAVQTLFDRGACLETSLGHGDLVGTNILAAGDRLVLVDWEHAQTMPIAFDLAKPLQQVADPVAALEALREGLDGTVPGGRDSYALEEQLALAYVRTLSGGARRRERAAAAGRLDALERESRRRLDLLAVLLDA